MKKLFFLIPALVLALAINAKEIQISSETSNIIHYTIAASTTSDGDVIVLTDAGPYVNSKANSDDYTKISKNVTIKAADGITPVVRLQVPIQGRDGKSAKFIGIKFDCGDLQYSNFIHFNDALDNGLEFEDCEFYNSSQYLVRVSDGKKVKSLKFKNCKFYNNSSTRGILNEGTIGHLELDGCEISGFVKEFIHGYSGSSHVDECIINDCYFHNNSRSSILFVASSIEGQQTCDELTVTNSTFANINATGEYEGVVEARPYGSANTDAIKVVVDHCTFYNNTTIDGSYSNIRTKYLTDVTVSNCIFAHSEEYARRATYCTGGGNINNCLTYNYTAEGTKGHAYGATVNAASVVADPLFNDLANNKYTIAGNWVTMNISPARAAATDGSDLGDPRWYSAEVLPETNFVSPYAFVGEKALISGNLWYNSTDDYLYYNDKEVCGTAKWKIHATRACAVKATLNMNAGTSTGHIFRVELLDANGNHVDEVAEPAQSSAAGDIDLPNPLAIPAEGDYTVILHNDQEWSSAKINSITLIYIGGAIVTIPAEEVVGAEAVLVNDGSLKVSKLANGDLLYGDNGEPLTEYVYWNINSTKDGNMDVALNIVAPGEGDPSGHRFLVELYTDLNASPIASTEEAADSYATGEIALPAITLPAAGNYIVKLTNQKQWSSAILHSIVFTYKGGSLITLPATMNTDDAMFSAKAYADGGEIYFSPNPGSQNVYGEWAKWNVKVENAGTFLFTLNVSSTNSQTYKMTILDGETEVDSYEEHPSSGDKTIKHYFNLAAGNYAVKVENTYSWSNGHIVSLVITQPELLVLDETAATNAVIHENYRNGNHDIQIIRSIVPNMYNTICLPFDVNSTQLKAIFGSDVELVQMASATLSGNALTLNFDDATSIYRGTPYLILTSKAVVNPIFTDVEIKEEEGQATDGTAADFIGNFIVGEIQAGDQNLFLGPNNKLYFSQDATPIKGMRAYFHVKVPGAANAIKHARIVKGTQVITAIDLVDADNNAIKTIENGQIIIIRDGIRYNVMGVKLQ